MVFDENGSPKPGAHVDMWYAGPDEFKPFRVYTGIRIGTNAGGDGRYEFSFDTNQQQFLGNTGLVGIVRAGNDVQLLPGGAAQIVRNLRHHAVETIAVGQSIMVSIRPDSSRTLNYFLADRFGISRQVDLSHVNEAFRVQIPRSGRLTIQTAGSGATLGGFCYYGPEECDYAPLTASSAGTLTGEVQGGTSDEIRVSIPSMLAPQQILLMTSVD